MRYSRDGHNRRMQKSLSLEYQVCQLETVFRLQQTTEGAAQEHQKKPQVGKGYKVQFITNSSCSWKLALMLVLFVGDVIFLCGECQWS